MTLRAAPSQAALRRGSAMLAPRPDAAAKPGIRLAKFTPITSSGSALAFLDIETPSGVIFRDCRLMRGPNGGFWIAMPSVKQTDRDGNPVLNDKGKPLYRNFVDFKDRATRDRFTEQVIGLVRNEHPDVVGSGA